jgi:adenosylmethionine-8-amino-7-oxononanoate aminotransferase
MARVELVRDKESREPYPWEEKMGWRAARVAMDEGVFIRPLGNVLVIMPPLAIGREHLARMCSVLEGAIEKATREG